VPIFCHQISFTSSAWPHVLESKDTFEAVRAPIESLGGKIRSAFFAIDSYDVLLISDLPDQVTIADIAVQFSAGGDVAHIHTTKLLGASEILEVIHNTGPYSYQPVSRPRARAVSAT
jgi:uncharacterized protein with GYD domain